jgi:TRAP-type C4-dicarboxylate transport system substrate-binding protein
VNRRTLLHGLLRGAVAGPVAAAITGCGARPVGGREVCYASAFSLPKSVDEALWLDFERRIETELPDYDVRLLIRGETGPEEQTFASLRRDRVQIAGGSFAGVATLVPEIALLSVPFLFEDEDEVDFVMDRYMLQPFRRLFAAQGLYLLHWTEVGWVNLYGKRPVLRPEDARGQRVRASSSIASQAFIREIGADTITMPFSDVVPSLQTGLIDAGVTSVTMYALSGISTEAPNYTLTRHSYDMGVLLANQRWLEGLQPRARAAFSLGFGGSAQTRRRARDAVAQLTRTLPGKGVRLFELEPAARAHWREVTWPAHEKLVARIGGDARQIYDTLLEGKRAWAAKRAAAGGPAPPDRLRRGRTASRSAAA